MRLRNLHMHSVCYSVGYTRTTSKDKMRNFFLKIAIFVSMSFQAAMIVVLGTIRIRRLHLHPPPIHIDSCKKDPYGVRGFRKIIDAGAFRIYGHWVKRGENQNRAALFENTPKRDIKISQRWCGHGVRLPSWCVTSPPQPVWTSQRSLDSFNIVSVRCWPQMTVLQHVFVCLCASVQGLKHVVPITAMVCLEKSCASQKR